MLLVVLLMGCVTNRQKDANQTNLAQNGPTPYQALAADLLTQIPNTILSVSVYPFTFGDSMVLSPCSAFLQGEVKTALGRHDQFFLLSRDADNEIMFEKLYKDLLGSSSSSLTTIGSGPPTINAQTILRGKIYFNPGHPTITLQVELVDCSSTKVMASSSIKVPVNEIPVSIVPSELDASKKNLKEVKKSLATDKNDFHLDVKIENGKNVFVEGESMRYQMKSELDCHVAILVHQVYGESVLLFPNDFKTDTRIKAGQIVNVPDNGDAFKFIVQAPFGADVIQVIACTDSTRLHTKLKELIKTVPSTGMGIRGVTRGVVVQGLSESLANSQSQEKWSTREIVVQTEPKTLR